MHEHLGRRVIYKGEPHKIISITHSARECRGGHAYALLPATERCLSKSIQYLTIDRFDFVPVVNEVCEIIKLRKMDSQEREEQETVLDTYLHALGMIADQQNDQ